MLAGTAKVPIRFGQEPIRFGQEPPLAGDDSWIPPPCRDAVANLVSSTIGFFRASISLFNNMFSS